MLQLMRRNLLVLGGALFLANIVYDFAVFLLFDAIGWIGRLQSSVFAEVLVLYVLPMLLTLGAVIAVKFRGSQAKDWHRPAALISSLVIPYVALNAFVVCRLLICLHIEGKTCFT